MNNQEFETDIVIIGAGPVGLFTIFQCGMLGLKCHVIDALDQIGGQCTALYPEKPIYDIPAYPKILGAELIERLEVQAEPFGPQYHLGQQVNDIKGCSEGGYVVYGSSGIQIRCGAVIVAAGGGAFGPNKPPIDNLSEYEGKSVFYACRSKEQFRDKRIVIAGGGDSAVDWALSLSEVAKEITLVHRRDKFRAAPDSIKKLNLLCDSGDITKIVPYQIKSIRGDNGNISNVVIEDMDNNKKDIELDSLLLFYGLSMDIGPISSWGIELSGNYIKVNQSTCETNMNAIYAVGDICTYDNKLKLILTGFAEAASAVHSAYGYINPDKEIHMEFSTSKGVPVND